MSNFKPLLEREEVSMWRVAAELVFWFHIAWIVGLVTGFLISWMPRYAKVRWFVAFGIGITWLGQRLFGGCPLTQLELFLLAKYDPNAVFHGSFIAHYVRSHLGVVVKEWYIDVALYAMITLFVVALVSRRNTKHA